MQLGYDQNCLIYKAAKTPALKGKWQSPAANLLAVKESKVSGLVLLINVLFLKSGSTLPKRNCLLKFFRYCTMSLLMFIVFQSLSHVQLSATPWTTDTRHPCPSPYPRVCSNLCPLSQWCPSTISSSVVAFSSCLQSFPTSGSFPISQ